MITILPGIIARARRSRITVPVNLLSDSKDFSAGTWTGTGVDVVDANVAIAPDSTTTGDKLKENTSTGQHRVYQHGPSITAGQNIKFSVNIKAVERSIIKLAVSDFATGGPSGFFNVSTGTTINSTVDGNWSGVTQTIADAGNGWYEISVTSQRITNAGDAYCLISMGTDNAVSDYAGNGTSGVYAWEAKLIIL